MNAAFINPAWHEVAVNLVFDDRGECCSHGLEPFYAAEKIVRDNDALNARAHALEITQFR